MFNIQGKHSIQRGELKGNKERLNQSKIEARHDKHMTNKFSALHEASEACAGIMWPPEGLGFFFAPSSFLQPAHRKLLSWAVSSSAPPGFLKCPRNEVTGAGCVVGTYNSYSVIPGLDKACIPKCPMAILSGGKVCTVTAQCVLGCSF